MAKSERRTLPADCLPYRPCVGVMILNKDGLVWAGHRIPEAEGEMEGAEQLWQMPQGGIDHGETALDAARRELYEETGIKSAKLIAEAPNWIQYDLPAHLIALRSKGSSAARARSGLPSDLRETRAKSPSILPPATILPNLTPGNGSR